MTIIFGPDAPSLEEQGIGLFVDCALYQMELDQLYVAVDSGEVSADEANKTLSKIAASLNNELGAILDKCVEPCLLIGNRSKATH